MSTALVRADGDATARAHGWADLSLKDRRLRAVAACRDRDISELWSLMEAWLVARGSRGANVSANTLDCYADGLKEFLAGSSSWSLISPPPDAGAMWVRQLEADGKAPSTVSVRLAAARTLYKALHWCGCWLDREGNPIRVDPFADVKAARDPTPAWEKRKPYSESELTRLLDAAQGSERLLLILGGQAGMRVSEMIALCWEDIDLAERTILVRRGKGGKSAHIPIGARTCSELAALYGTGYVLTYRSDDAARAHMKALCGRAGAPYRGIHSLRHRAGTALYQQTKKLELCQRLLRHSSISTAQIYVHYADTELRRSLKNW